MNRVHVYMQQQAYKVIAIINYGDNPSQSKEAIKKSSDIKQQS